jgi:ribosomal protein S12 methylthiotransferase
MGDRQYWLQTLGCPKNQVDSDKLVGLLTADGFTPADDPAHADLVVVNTCAFIEEARQESVDTVLELAAARREGARLVVTGCMAERYGAELAEALPEVDLVAGFGEAFDGTSSAQGATSPVVVRGRREMSDAVRSFDLLELPRPASARPWAYVKVAEGCDRLCGFCAIPSFRGLQRSRPVTHVLEEVEQLVAGGAREIVLVAQDLASYGRDRRTTGAAAASDEPDIAGAPIVALTKAVAERAQRTRLLYLYPSGLTDALIDAVLGTGVPYFDLSLQHVSRPHLRRMRRWGDGERFLRRIEDIRRLETSATFRSSFILGYPGETEEDHDALLGFLEAAQLDWAGFFTYSREEGTYADGLADHVPHALALERLRECAELQDAITARRRDEMVGRSFEVLVDAPGTARTVHEAPEIDGVVDVPRTLAPGSLVDVVITEATGTDLVATPAPREARPLSGVGG